VTVRIRVDGNGWYIQLSTAANDTDCYLTPVGDQDLFEHYLRPGFDL